MKNERENKQHHTTWNKAGKKEIKWYWKEQNIIQKKKFEMLKMAKEDEIVLRKLINKIWNSNKMGDVKIELYYVKIYSGHNIIICSK